MKLNFKKLLVVAALVLAPVSSAYLSLNVYADVQSKSRDFAEFRENEKDSHDKACSLPYWMMSAIVYNVYNDVRDSLTTDAMFGCSREFENTIGQYDFKVFVDAISRDSFKDSIDLYDSALKGQSKVKIKFKRVDLIEKNGRKEFVLTDVLTKESNLDSDGCFNFSLNKNEIEFGKTYELHFFGENDKFVGAYPSLSLPEVKPLTEKEAVERIGKFRSFGTKAEAKG